MGMGDNQGSRHARTVVYLRDTEHRDRDQRRCLDYCRQRRYIVVALVVDDADGSRWADAARMLATGEAEIIVVPDRSHLPPDRIPRVEACGERGDPIPRQRRPRIIVPPSHA